MHSTCFEPQSIFLFPGVLALPFEGAGTGIILDDLQPSTSDPRTWELAAPTSSLRFTLSSVEPRSKIMFLSTACQSGAKQATNLKSRNISFKTNFFSEIFLKTFT